MSKKSYVEGRVSTVSYNAKNDHLCAFEEESGHVFAFLGMLASCSHNDNYSVE